MKNEKPLILVCNDDGVTAPGIQSLIAAARPFGELIAVAPDKPQSGMGHAITINNTLRVNLISEDEGLKVYSCSGTPVDCVKIAVNKILPRKPDVVISGINHGSNSSINVIYSGTMSAAIEGSLEGIPSAGFSLCDFDAKADFTASKHFAAKIIDQMLTYGLPRGVCLNVNIPKLPLSEVKGIKICRQANANWEEDFDERTDPFGRKYFWLTGEFKNYDEGDDTDEYALKSNFVSVVPVQYDLTAYNAIKKLKAWSI